MKMRFKVVRTTPTAEELVSSTSKDFVAPKCLKIANSGKTLDGMSHAAIDLRLITHKMIRELK